MPENALRQTFALAPSLLDRLNEQTEMVAWPNGANFLPRANRAGIDLVKGDGIEFE